MFDWFHKALSKNTFLLEMILHLEKKKKQKQQQQKHVISTPACLTLLFQKKCDWLKGGLGG